MIKQMEQNEDKEINKWLKDTHLREMLSPYIIQYQGYFRQNRSLYLVMEYAPKGSLRDEIDV